MAQAARPPEPKLPNPCAAFRPPPSPARRPDAAPWPARPKDAPCPTSTGDRGHPGQLKKPPHNVMHKPSGGTYTKPEARVKLIPAEEITYVRHGKTFGRTVGSNNLEKRHFRRSVTPPPSSRKVYLAPLTHKATMPPSHKAMMPPSHKAAMPPSHKGATPLSHKAVTPLSLKSTTPLPLKSTTPLSQKVTTPLTQKATEPLAHKPTTPPPPVASCISAKRFETAENRQIISLNRPSPVLKVVQRGAIPPAVLQKESEMNLISPSSVHVIPAHLSKVPIGTKAEPSSKCVSKLDNTKLCSTSNQATLKCQRTKIDADPVVEKEHTVKPSLLSPTSVLEASISCNMSSGAPAVIHKTTYKKPEQSKSTTQVPHVELSNYFEAVPSTKSHIRNEQQTSQEEQQTNQEASISCNMSSGNQGILHAEVYKKPYQPESTTRGPCVGVSTDLDDVPSTKSHMRNERQTNQEASISCNMPSGAPLILHTELRKKTYRPEACWKGKFEVTGEITHTCDEVEAHFPLEIFIKVYEASKQMPEVLKLEALPLSHLLPKKFKMEPPDANDIGLCFISSHQRPNGNFDHLLETVSSHIGLRTDIGTTELLIFSSKLLTEDDQTKDGKFYFCGVFRKPLRKKQPRDNNHTDNVDISKYSLSKRDIGMNLDMTEDKYIGNRCEIGMKLDASEANKPMEIGKIFDMTTDKQTETVKCKKSGIKLGLTGDEETIRVNKCFPMPKTPDVNAVIIAAPAVSFFTGSCSPDSAGSPCKSAMRAPACGDPGLDSPSGFSADIPPGFTRAHCRLRTAESQIDPSSSLILDTPGFLDVPPGFTSADRGLHTNDAITSPGSENGVSTLFSEKKPPIKFSLNITRPVQKDVPPGLAKLLQVKKEAGLPAFSKAAEKIAPVEKVDVDGDDGSEERQFPKIRRLSDILGFSSSNNASTSSRPRNCSEVCRSAAPVPSASKFQETGPPEREKSCRKRGQPEPSEPSAAEASKRLKVNGRMALNGSMDCRALNSNQAQGNGGKS